MRAWQVQAEARPLPFTTGQAATGIVTAVGARVGTPIGSRVMCVTAFYIGHGSFAADCPRPSLSAFPLPAGLTDAQAAGPWIPHLTGWVGLVEPRPYRGGRVARGSWSRRWRWHRRGATRSRARRPGDRGRQRRLVFANASLVGVFAGGESRDEVDHIHSELSRLVRAGNLHDAVTSSPAFRELSHALQRLADRRDVGKLVLAP